MIIFGLKEEQSENLSGKVEAVFLTIGQKPKFEARRFGKDKTSRPVRVTLDSSSAVQDVLKEAKGLKSTEFSDAYLCPDRSPEQRKEHKIVVQQLNKKIEENPGKRFYIKGGKVFEADNGTQKEEKEELEAEEVVQPKTPKKKEKVDTLPSFVRHKGYREAIRRQQCSGLPSSDSDD